MFFHRPSVPPGLRQKSASRFPRSAVLGVLALTGLWFLVTPGTNSGLEHTQHADQRRARPRPIAVTSWRRPSVASASC